MKMNSSRYNDVSEHNRQMWERLARAGHTYTRASGRLPSSQGGLRRLIDPVESLGGVSLEGRRVLVIAGGGGWHPAAFAKLGCDVSLLDISPTQLETAVKLAERAGVSLRAVEGDMRDLSAFGSRSFDLVWHVHSLVFVDEPEPVFVEVERVLKRDGLYRMETMHPVALRMYDGWSGSGWNFRIPYHDAHPIPWSGPAIWDDGKVQVEAPTMEYGHSIQRMINGLAAAGMAVVRVWEYSPNSYEEAVPGSDEHVENEFPVFIDIRAVKGPIAWPPPGSRPARTKRPRRR